MRIYFDYPLATEENMKAVHDAINAGKDVEELVDQFDSEVVWDCVVMLSGNKDTPWLVFDNMVDNVQTHTEDWQEWMIGNYVFKQQLLQSCVTPKDGRTEYAFRIDSKYFLIRDHEDGWEYYLLNSDYEVLEDGVEDDLDLPLGEAVKRLLEEFHLSPDDDIEKYNFNTLYKAF